jgi:hypothetical protein
MIRIAVCAILLALVVACAPGPRPSPSPSLIPVTPHPSPTAAPSPSPSPSPPPVGDICLQGGVTLCVLNPAVTPATIHSTVCVSGWTTTIRPPASYTDALKVQQLAQFASLHPGDAQWNVPGTEEDHRLPLDLGGDPRDPMNLSPEVHRTSTVKDKDESSLGGSHGAFCAAGLSPDEAWAVLQQKREALLAKWLGAWPAYLR